MTSSARVRRLRQAIAVERQRQNECDVYLVQSTKRLTNCKQSPVTQSVIRVASTTRRTRTRSRSSCDWQSHYQLERGDWAAPVKVRIECYRSEALEQTRRRIAGAHIATWYWRQRLRAKIATGAVKTIATLPTKLVQRRVSPSDVLRRVQEEIAAKARYQVQSRAARVLQRFFGHVLLVRTSKGKREERVQRRLAADAARKQRAAESLRRDRAARFIQALFRNRSARQQHHAWKTSKNKASYCRVLVLEADYVRKPSAAALLQLATTYTELTMQPEYASQHPQLLRLSLLFVSKAVAFGYVPEDPAVFWLDVGERFVALWRIGGHVEVVLLQQAVLALERAVLGPAVPEAWLLYIEVLMELGLFCQALKAIDRYARALERATPEGPRRRHRGRPTATWRWQAQAYFHLGDADAALGLLEEMRLAPPDTRYSRSQLLLLAARCHDVARGGAENPFYDELIRALYAADDITRHELSAALVRDSPVLLLDLGLHCVAQRDFVWALDLLQRCVGDVPSTELLEGLAQSYFGVGNAKKCAETLAALHDQRAAVWQWHTAVQRQAMAFESDHRVSVIKVRSHFGVHL
ncbi:hypothetical protein ACHHYP_07125 [Achlya hypogyna]|uniref:Uncharacterized protein n=1 Tax=Achlya hypogyna TaxID=1202772 RepID=A0A1V9ZMS3_ACHHY|nr:hypothetical protein ACHHYP_07125 [Achlya hypogyna]